MTLAILYERFEQVSSELADIDKKSDKEFEDMKNATETSKEAQRLAEIAMNAASGTRGLYCWMATSFDDSEVALHEELGGMDKTTMITATATATSAMSSGTGDRAENEQDDSSTAKSCVHPRPH